MRRNTPERFWSRVDRREPNACWVWLGGRSRGYGYLKYQGVTWIAHRLAYSLSVGPIPNDLDIAHRCDNPSCVNPAHLFPASHAENMADMKAKGRGNSGNRSKTHCKRGHEFTEENTYRTTAGRQCRICRRYLFNRWWNEHRVADGGLPSPRLEKSHNPTEETAR